MDEPVGAEAEASARDAAYFCGMVLVPREGCQKGCDSATCQTCTCAALCGFEAPAHEVGMTKKQYKLIETLWLCKSCTLAGVQVGKRRRTTTTPAN